MLPEPFQAGSDDVSVEFPGGICVFIKWRKNELMLTITEYSYENSKTKLRTARQRVRKM